MGVHQLKEKLKITAFLSLCFVVAACGPSAPPPVSTQQAPLRVAETNSEPQNTEVEEVVEAVTDPLLSGEKIKVAIMLPLSGSEAATGQALLRAAVTALFDAHDPRIVLLPYDTKADFAETEILAKRAIEEGVSIVLGPLLSSNLTVAADILEPAGIPVISFSNDSSAAAPGRFIMGFIPETEVKRVVDHAVGAGLLEQAALIPEGRYGDRIREAFGDALSLGGGRVAAIESYSPDPDAVFEPVKRLSNYDERRQDMRDEIRFLRSLGDDLTDEIAAELGKSEVLEGITYDAVLLPEGGELLGTLAPLLPFYEIDPNKVKLLGTGLWNDPSLLREPPLQGAWFAAPMPQAPRSLLDRLEESFGDAPPRIATLAYDATALVAHLIKTYDPSFNIGMFDDARLLDENGFTGVDGLFRFLPDGTIERSLAVLEINRRGFVIVDPAPDAFPSFGYALRQPLRQPVSQE